MTDRNRPLRLGMHTYTLHFFGLGESWGFGKDYYFEQTMSLYELMDKAVKWELDGLQITKVDLLTTAEKDPFGTENLKKVAQAAKEHGLFLECSMDCPKMVSQIREKSPMDKIIFENEIAFRSMEEPIEEARARELQACEESVRYLRDVLKLGVRNR